MDKVNEFEHGIDSNTKDGVNINYVTFPIESNLHYRFSSAEDLLDDLDTLAAMIMDHYQNQVPRLEVLDEYSKARNTNILRNQRRKEKRKPIIVLRITLARLFIRLMLVTIQEIQSRLRLKTKRVSKRLMSSIQITILMA